MSLYAYVYIQGMRDMDSSLCFEESHRSVCQRWGKRLRPGAQPRSAHRQSCSYQDVKEQQRAGLSQDSHWPSLITHLTHFLAIINTQPEQMAPYSNRKHTNVQRGKNQGETLLVEKGLKLFWNRNTNTPTERCWVKVSTALVSWAWGKYRVSYADLCF